METDIRGFFCSWKPLLIFGEIQFLKSIPAREILFVVGETDFPASGIPFFLHFSMTPLGPFSV